MCTLKYKKNSNFLHHIEKVHNFAKNVYTNLKTKPHEY